jgi:hypothetical protein
MWVLGEGLVGQRIRHHEHFIVQNRVIAEGMVSRHFSCGAAPMLRLK